MEELYTSRVKFCGFGGPSLWLCSMFAAYAQVHTDQQILAGIIPLIQQRQFVEAEAKFSEGLEQFPASAVLSNALGIVYREQGRTDEAGTAFRKAIDL